jgi:hypothetical protein
MCTCVRYPGPARAVCTLLWIIDLLSYPHSNPCGLVGDERRRPYFLPNYPLYPEIRLASYTGNGAQLNAAFVFVFLDGSSHALPYAEQLYVCARVCALCSQWPRKVSVRLVTRLMTADGGLDCGCRSFWRNGDLLLFLLLLFLVGRDCGYYWPIVPAPDDTRWWLWSNLWKEDW